MHFDIITVIGLIGGAFYLASHYMRAMVPLRVLSLCSNVLLIIFSVFHLEFDWAKLIVLPEFLLNSILLPMNAKRLIEIMRLTKRDREGDREVAGVRMAAAAHAPAQAQGRPRAVPRGRRGRRDLLRGQRPAAAGRRRRDHRPGQSGRRDRAVLARQEAHADGRLRDRLRAVHDDRRADLPALLPEPEAGLLLHAAGRRPAAAPTCSGTRRRRRRPDRGTRSAHRRCRGCRRLIR